MGMIEILSSTDTVMHYVNCVADVENAPTVDDQCANLNAGSTS